MSATTRIPYTYNRDCHCDWCRNMGRNPTKGNPATLGYDEPHIPAPLKPSPMQGETKGKR
jgi:hypothetical protein